MLLLNEFEVRKAQEVFCLKVLGEFLFFDKYHPNDDLGRQYCIKLLTDEINAQESAQKLSINYSPEEFYEAYLLLKEITPNQQIFILGKSYKNWPLYIKFGFSNRTVENVRKNYTEENLGGYMVSDHDLFKNLFQFCLIYYSAMYSYVSIAHLEKFVLDIHQNLEN